MPGKREQFTQPKRSNLPVICGAIAVLLALGFIFIRFGGTREAGEKYFGEPVAAPRSYVGRFVSMTKVEPLVENGRISISFTEVDQNNIVYFEVENNQGLPVPLMAYITPTGRLFAGSSMCEPCRGRTFSLAGETMVCDTCRTTYTIESHRFISGAAACGSYPPVNLYPVIENGRIYIEEQLVLNWRPRV